MHDIFFWVVFFGAPLLLIATTAYVYRPSARAKYHEAKMLPFADAKYPGRRNQ
jgi:cbb3-type cytochrome oxidase subunit 3